MIVSRLRDFSLTAGDGQDEVHIGDGISEGTQVDLVPDHMKNDKEKVANISGVEGIELAERTIIVQSKVRKVFSGLFNGFSKQKGVKKPSEIAVADIKTAIKKLKNLVKEKFEGETRILELLEYISNKEERMSLIVVLILSMNLQRAPQELAFCRAIPEF